VAGLTDSPDRVERSGFDAVYGEQRPRVVRTAYLVVGSYAVAEELAQEAFVRLHERFDSVDNPGGFLRTAVVRLAISWRRRDLRERMHLATVDEPEATGEMVVDETWDALTALSPERRAALVLRFYEDLSHEEIAAAMGCRVATARTRVHRALADLRKELER
jgi:RNA polymerase sigma factor (sigma-70 family)